MRDAQDPARREGGTTAAQGAPGLGPRARDTARELLPAEFSISISEYDRRRILAIGGELDLASAAQFERQLGELCALGGELVVDLSGLAFVDSAGIRLLLEARHRARHRGGSLIVLGASGHVRRVLEVAGVLDILAGAE
jgi:anti-anti-sigma factor